jgi:hypothetical protein
MARTFFTAPANLRTDHIVRKVGPEGWAGEAGADRLTDIAVFHGQSDGGGEAGGDLVSEGRAGEDGNRRLRLLLAGDVMHELRRRLFHPLCAEDQWASP